jgi:hypothetical protein
MIQKLTIPGELPGLNEILAAATTHRMAYATMKSDYTGLVVLCTGKIKKIEGPAHYCITWYSRNAKRDPDNVAGGIKFIFDGLVAAGKIPNDTRKYIKGIEHRFEIDRKEPRVEVIIEEGLE